MEHAVTEAWLEPKRAIKVQNGHAVTHEIVKGRLIPKTAK
jgi:hypothetical protein